MVARSNPDGHPTVRQIVVQTGPHRRRLGKLTSSQLMIYDITMAPARAMRSTWRSQMLVDASWSPDGSRILFAGNPPSTARLGSDPQAASSACGRTAATCSSSRRAPPRRPAAPSWTPDGRILYFHNNLHGVEGSPQMGRNGLWLMDADGSNQAPLSNTFPDLREHHERMGVLRSGSRRPRPRDLHHAPCTGGIVPPVSPSIRDLALVGRLPASGARPTSAHEVARHLQHDARPVRDPATV